VASGTGNLHDVVASVLYDDTARNPAAIWDKFKLVDPYIYAPTSGGDESNPGGLALANTLDGIVTLLSTITSHANGISTNVAIKLSIPANQDPGTYVGTITYTLMAQD
jgi:hypothetical protein